MERELLVTRRVTVRGKFIPLRDGVINQCCLIHNIPIMMPFKRQSPDRLISPRYHVNTAMSVPII